MRCVAVLLLCFVAVVEVSAHGPFKLLWTTNATWGNTPTAHLLLANNTLLAGTSTGEILSMSTTDGMVNWRALIGRSAVRGLFIKGLTVVAEAMFHVVLTDLGGKVIATPTLPSPLYHSFWNFDRVSEMMFNVDNNENANGNARDGPNKLYRFDVSKATFTKIFTSFNRIDTVELAAPFPVVKLVVGASPVVSVVTANGVVVASKNISYEKLVALDGNLFAVDTNRGVVAIAMYAKCDITGKALQFKTIPVVGRITHVETWTNRTRKVLLVTQENGNDFITTGLDIQTGEISMAPKIVTMLASYGTARLVHIGAVFFIGSRAAESGVTKIARLNLTDGSVKGVREQSLAATHRGRAGEAPPQIIGVSETIFFGHWQRIASICPNHLRVRAEYVIKEADHYVNLMTWSPAIDGKEDEEGTLVFNDNWGVFRGLEPPEHD